MIHFVTHEFAPFRGGIATYVRETARAAAALGFPVRVIAPDYGLAHHPTDMSENFPIDRVRCSGRLTPAGIWSLARSLAARRKVLHDSKIVLLSPGAIMAMMIARELKWISSAGPMVSFFHGSEVLRFPSPSTLAAIGRPLFAAHQTRLRFAVCGGSDSPKRSRPGRGFHPARALRMSSRSAASSGS